MALGVDAAGDGKADEFQLGIDHFATVGIGMGEHDRADLARTDSTFQVEFHCQRLAGEFAMRNMGEYTSGINIDGMTAGAAGWWGCRRR